MVGEPGGGLGAVGGAIVAVVEVGEGLEPAFGAGGVGFGDEGVGFGLVGQSRGIDYGGFDRTDSVSGGKTVQRLCVLDVGNVKEIDLLRYIFGDFLFFRYPGSGVCF